MLVDSSGGGSPRWREREGQYVRHFFGGLRVVTCTCSCTLCIGVCGAYLGGFDFAPYRFVLNSVTSHITMVIVPTTGTV
jgi:hypothetical protein